jgi:hypothetical protein
MTAPRFCIDCKWVKFVLSNHQFNTCTHPTVQSPIDGTWKASKNLPANYCSTLRLGGWLESIILNSCGESGRWWEQKEQNK